MADTKITALTALTAADPANDVLPIVDVSDTTMAASGTTKKISVNNILGASGTATLASATITGDLTVDTSTLKVDSANNRVGIGLTSPTQKLELLVAPATNSLDGLRVSNGTESIAAYITGATYSNYGVGGNTAWLLSGTNSLAIGPYGSPGIVTIVTGGNERYRIASDGVATWSNVGGVAGTAMTLNSTGLGVGASPSFKLDVQSTTATFQLKSTTGTNAAYLFTNNTGGDFYFGRDNSTGATFGSGTGYSAILYSAGAYPMAFFTNAIERMRIDSTGNVGIGVAPSAWASNYKSVQTLLGAALAGKVDGLVLAQNCYYDGTNWVNNRASTYSARYDMNVAGNSVHAWYVYNGVFGSAGNTIPFVQAMTLDASGNLLVGTTSAISSGSTFQNLGTARQVLTLKGDSSGSYTLGVWNASTTNDAEFQYFGTETSLTVRGSISYNRAGGLVAYNTTSDYRAKDIIGPVSNSGSIIDSLKVYVGKMKGATIERPMLIAHEAQEVAPYAVTGTKDEVDADGKPKYQQMDASALVPLLIAEIQSLRTRVQTLETR